jgi:hypothetical protein
LSLRDCLAKSIAPNKETRSPINLIKAGDEDLFCSLIIAPYFWLGTIVCADILLQIINENNKINEKLGKYNFTMRIVFLCDDESTKELKQN